MKIFKTLLVLVVLVVLFAGGASAYAYSSESLPGELLYPFQIIAEKAVSLTIMDPAAKAEFALQRAQRRLNEAAELNKQGADQAAVNNLLATAKVNLEDVGTLKETLNTEQLTALEPKLQSFQNEVLSPLSENLPDLKSLKNITWLDPQPEPPMAGSFDQLDPQPEPPMIGNLEQLDPQPEPPMIKALDTLDPQPEPPAPLDLDLTNTDIVNEKLINSGLNPQPEPPASDPNLQITTGNLGTGLSGVGLNPQPEPPLGISVEVTR